MSDTTTDQVPADAKPKRKKKAPAVVDKHHVVGGARWHYPKAGSPTECGVEGCDRVLRDPRLVDDLENVEADPDAAEVEE